MQVPTVWEDDARPADQGQPLYAAEPAWGLSLPQPAFLPGSPVEETDRETDPDSPPTPAGSLGRNILVSKRGSVLALSPPASNTSASFKSSHLITGDTSAVEVVTALPQSRFSLRGELMHAFLSYRVNTEGPSGNNLSGLIAEKIRTLSMDGTQELQIPRHGWGIWLKAAKMPMPFRKEEAKVFLDRDCLLDGQSWLAGFVQGWNPNPTPKPQTLHPTPCTLRPARCTPHPYPYAGWRPRWCVCRC